MTEPDGDGGTGGGGRGGDGAGIGGRAGEARVAEWPPGVATAWGLRERPAKGPRPALSVDRIVATAVRLATAEGLAAVSMGQIAKELGVATMSLYRHVASKDELLVLMQEAAYGLPPAPDDSAAGWRDALARWAWDQRAVLRRHMWLLHIPVSGPPATPHSIAWMERGLAALGGTGLGPGEKLGVIMLVSGFVRHETGLMADIETARSATGAGPGEVLTGYVGMLTELVDPERFPEVAKVVGSGVMTQEDGPDDEFAFQLGILLDGVEELVRKHGVRTSHSGSGSRSDSGSGTD